jgi:NADP-dependent 3-hydroxy acid dehydrogenase YdfG
VVAEAGVPDILINNAGSGRWAYLDDSSYAEIDEMIAAPLHAALCITRAFLPGMLHRGTGMIGNVTFIGVFLPWAGATGCTAVRWGMRGFHEALRADLKGTNLTTTPVAASAVEKALVRRRAVLVLPAGMQLLRAPHCLIPGWVDRVMQRSTALTRKHVDQRRAQLY